MTDKRPDALADAKQALEDAPQPAPALPVAWMKRIDVAAEALSLIQASTNLGKLETMASLACEGLRGIQAVAAGCTRSHPHENMDSSCHAKSAIAEMQSMAVRGAEATAQDLERFVSMFAAAPTTQPVPQREPAEIDTATMALAESVGLIGPASRTHDLHGAIRRFHDLICANATIKAAQMAAEAISAAAPQPVAREPLPSVEIMRIVMGVEQQHNFLRGTTNWATAVGRAVERAHGIGGQHG